MSYNWLQPDHLPNFSTASDFGNAARKVTWPEFDWREVAEASSAKQHARRASHYDWEAVAGLGVMAPCSWPSRLTFHRLDHGSTESCPSHSDTIYRLHLVS